MGDLMCDTDVISYCVSSAYG